MNPTTPSPGVSPLTENEISRHVEMTHTRYHRHTLVLILLLSVLLRVAIAFYYGDVVDAPPLLTDQRSYHWLGAQIAAGEGYTFPTPWYPFTPASTPTAHWSFLYPLFVAGVYTLFGVHPLAARLAQAVFGGLLLPWMVYRLTSTLFRQHIDAKTPGRQDGTTRDTQALAWSHARSPEPWRFLPLVAALWAAVYPYFALYSATIMTESFYITALLWSLDLALQMGRLLRARARVPWPLTFQLGLSLGIAAVLRQSILPWVPVLCLWLAWQALGARGPQWDRASGEGGSTHPAPERARKTASNSASVVLALRRLGPVVAAGLILIACILPWTVRNYRVYGEFLLLNSNTGYAMYSAQHPLHGTRFREFDAAPLPEDLGPLRAAGNEAQLDRALMQRAIGFVLDDPGRYLLLSLSRVRAYFEFWPTPDTTLVHNIGRVGSFGIALPFMLYGIGLALGQARSAAGHRPSAGAERQAAPNPAPASSTQAGRTAGQAPGKAGRPAQLAASELGLLLGFIAFYSALHIFTWAMVRYRLPVDAVALPFAALAVVDLASRLLALLPLKRGQSPDLHP